MVDIRTPIEPAGDDRFEQVLRQRLHALADHAPTLVRSIDEVAVVHADRRAGRARAARDPRRRRVAGIGATVATLAAGLGLTTIALNGAGDPGAPSAEAAVTRFVEALEAQDVLGMIDILDPAEVPAARAAVETGRNEAERVGLVSGGLTLDSVAGVDVDVTDLSLTTTPVFDDMAVVAATNGTASISFDPVAFPLGDALAEYFDRDSLRGSATAELGGRELPVQVAAVRRDGRWYVSTSYTVAEYLRLVDDRPPAPETASLSPIGSTTPEAAAEAWYDALVSFDLDAAARLVAPGAGDAVLRYANVWLPSAVDDLEQLRADGWDLQLDGLRMQIDGDSDVRTARATEFTISGTTSSSVASQPVLDPALPTIVYTFDGGFAVVPAGVSLPESIDELTVQTDFGLLDELAFNTSSSDELAYNTTSSDELGVIYPMALPSEALTGPQPLTVALSDGCTTWSGAQIDGLFALSGGRFEHLSDGSYRACGASVGLLGVFALPVGSLGGGLPAVTVQQVDGRWYVSPVGTLADLALDLVRAVPEGGTLFDSELAAWVYGIDRDTMVMLLEGVPLDQVAAACRSIVLDDGQTVTGLVDDPGLAEVRSCWDDGVLGEMGMSASTGISVSGGAIEVEVEAVEVDAVEVDAVEVDAAEVDAAEVDADSAVRDQRP